ncbi:MAG: hypothetical protein ACR2LM_10910 [Pyrinomonadaceae bacterium]
MPSLRTVFEVIAESDLRPSVDQLVKALHKELLQAGEADDW